MFLKTLVRWQELAFRKLFKRKAGDLVDLDRNEKQMGVLPVAHPDAGFSFTVMILGVTGSG